MSFSMAQVRRMCTICLTRMKFYKPIGKHERISVSYSNLPQMKRLMSSVGSSQGNEPEKESLGKRGPITWKVLGYFIAVGSVIVIAFRWKRKSLERKHNEAWEGLKEKSVGRPSIGGTFSLIDHEGKPRSSSDFHGQWILLYFGFTHCPDICPDELEKMIDVVDKIDSMMKLPKLTPVFITIDPERDTVAVVKEYIKEFSPKLVGLTGTIKQVEEASRAYRIYFSPGPKDADNDYIVDHSIIMYLVNPDGNFVEYYGQNATATDMVPSIAKHMLRFKKLS
ncbi:hypothetical protein CHS0354_012345 [Potamilus streckersoni]|uniref:Uncharacterized protein n=1 Tax=Potamilus streckersoni TaxID=2493646 RepID=A0AAE0SJS4_9BIVA|nr:hypothetical protein CHS0354_012345 [Potamilus streckersoni]